MSGDATGARVRAVAAEAIDAVVTGGQSLDAALARAADAIDAADVALLSELTYGCLRHHYRLAAWADALLERPLKKKDRVINALLAVGFHQLGDMRVPDHAAVSLTVEAARRLGRPHLAGLVNAVLRRFLRERPDRGPPADDAARFDHPPWLIERIGASWPDERDAILAANNERAPMWLRVNRRRTNRADYLAALADAGIEASTLPGLDDAIRLAAPMPAAELPGFDEGRVSVQDGAAQIAAPWLVPGNGARVLDACAAPGGKSAHLAELGGGDIDLTCMDLDAQRLTALEENLARLGLEATVLTGDAASPREWWDGRPYHRVLLDAPCSASGVIRRHPDIKLLRRDSDIDGLEERQRAMLEALWPLVAGGGRLLYATCSVLTAENDAVIASFLDATPDAVEEEMLHNNNIRDLMRRTVHGYQVLPGTAGLDGFYYASIEKVA